MKIKPQIRILGIDDGSLCGEEILLVGVVFRGGFWIDGLLSCWIERDGTDATDKIINMVSTTKHEDLRVIMTDGITFAGFNTIDIQKIAQKTSLGIIPVMRKMPDFEKIDRALDNFPDKKERWHCIERAGPVHSIPVHRGVLYFQYAGLERDEAVKIIELTCMHSQLPEPVRVAHIIATGIIRGEASRKP
ncbi:MAG: DUF99 family protein [Theionarchaea archaeon]|nr:MAG: hypothetical protein AYK19_16995 [Theionarchaea archaeon DG-70-1]MBU7027851.1 DUF99 family protein [Theionarchaea archaeon]